MARNRIELLAGSSRKDVPAGTLAEDRRDPVGYFINCVRGDQAIDGMVSAEFNIDVMQIVGAAQRSAASGKPVMLK
jgi:hypothetical protein